MTFTVVWSSNAEARPASAWMQADDRRTVTTAAERIDKALREKADTLGESRGERRRIYHEPPLGVLVTVRPDDRVVHVLDVWRYNPPRT